MQLISSDKDTKKYELKSQAKGYTMQFTIKDHHKNSGRANSWETSEIKVESEEPQKCVECKMQYDCSGNVIRTTLVDSNKIQRVRKYFFSSGNDRRLASMVYGRNGLIWLEENKWAIDSIKLPLELGDDEYYYSEKEKKFLNRKKEEPPKTIVAVLELPTMFEKAGKHVSEKYKTLTEKGTVAPEEISMDDDIISLE